MRLSVLFHEYRTAVDKPQSSSQRENHRAKIVTPPPPRGEQSLGPESIENTRRQRHQRKFLQGAEADLHCDPMVQFCGAIPPPGGAGGGGVTGLTKGGILQEGGWGSIAMFSCAEQGL